MRVAIDSNILISLLGDEKLDDIIEKFFENIKENHEGILSPIAYTEVLIGFYFTDEPEKAILDFNLFLENYNIKILNFDEKVSLRTAKHAFDIIKKGSTGKAFRDRKPDLFIISHAEAFADVFVTNNKKHYKNLEVKIPVLNSMEFLKVYLVWVKYLYQINLC